jgi:hypothetical protein
MNWPIADSKKKLVQYVTIDTSKTHSVWKCIQYYSAFVEFGMNSIKLRVLISEKTLFLKSAYCSLLCLY